MNYKKTSLAKMKVGIWFMICFGFYTMTYSQNQPNGMEEQLANVRNSYENENYEQAFLTLRTEVFQATGYKKSTFEDKVQALQWGIRLAFLLNQFDLLDKYLDQYYKLDAYLSKDLFRDERLKIYVENYLETKGKNFVYVNKHPQDVDLAPATISIYTKDDIERLGVRNLLDLIRITPGFAEIGDNNERVFGTRGSSNTTLQDVLFLINGHRITDVLTNSNAPDWISLDYVEQIELVKGPGSALYGGSAFSGVVNIVTKDGSQDFNKLEVRLGTGGSPLSEMENQAYKVNFQLAKKINNQENIFVSATYIQSGGSQIDYSESEIQPILDDTDGTNTLRSADLNGVEFINRYEPGYNILLNYNIKKLQVTANAQSSTFVHSRPASLNLWNSFDQDSLRHLRRRKDKRQFVQVEYQMPLNLRLKLSGDHFYKDFYTNEYSFGINGDARLVGDEHRGTFNLEYVSNSEDKNPEKNESHLLIGVEAFFNNWFYNYYEANDTAFVLNNTGDQFSDAPGDSRFEYVGAAYFQSERHLVPNRVVTTVGVRFNYHNEYSTFEEFEYGQTFSPRLAAVIRPFKNPEQIRKYQLKVLYNSAFLPPPFLYRRGGISQFVGTDDLNSQSIESGELVLFGELNDNFKYNVSLYANKIDNLISRQDTVFVNDLREKRVTGNEVDINYTDTLNNVVLACFANYTFSKLNNFKDSVKHNYFSLFRSELYDTEDALTRYPRTHFNAGITLDFGGNTAAQFGLPTELLQRSVRFALGLNAQWIGPTAIESQYFINEAGQVEQSTEAISQELSSALVLNGHATVKWDQFKLRLALYNATDKEYYLPSAISKIQRQRAEGRMVFLQFTYTHKNRKSRL